jgi:hypothetical protein
MNNLKLIFFNNIYLFFNNIYLFFNNIYLFFNNIYLFFNNIYLLKKLFIKNFIKTTINLFIIKSKFYIWKMIFIL